jgi:hypothetical protein
MKQIMKYILFAFAISTAIVSCKKEEANLNGAANSATAGASYLSLNNRIMSAFVIDSSSFPQIPAGILPISYNRFRKQLTYDTIATANKPRVYNVGDAINIVAFVKGDDSAIAKRSISFKFFGVPTIYPGASAATNWIKAISNPPQSPIQAAEDSIRGFVPRSIDVLNTVNVASIVVNNTFPINITKVNAEQINGIAYSTYIVQLSYVIPAALSGKLTSINFSVGTGRNDIGTVNWNYAFRVN